MNWKYALLGLLIIICITECCEAKGYWFKTISVTGGIGEEVKDDCLDDTCGEYDVGPGKIGHWMLRQSIYNLRHSDKVRLGITVTWDHMSDIKEDYYETPIDFYGLDFILEFDWY